MKKTTKLILAIVGILAIAAIVFLATRGGNENAKTTTSSSSQVKQSSKVKASSNSDNPVVLKGVSYNTPNSYGINLDSIKNQLSANGLDFSDNAFIIDNTNTDCISTGIMGGTDSNFIEVNLVHIKNASNAQKDFAKPLPTNLKDGDWIYATSVDNDNWTDNQILTNLQQLPVVAK